MASREEKTTHGLYTFQKDDVDCPVQRVAGGPSGIDK